VNAGWLTNRLPQNEEIDKITEVISVNNSEDNALDDFTTKSRSMAFLRSVFIRKNNTAFKNTTKNVVDQKYSNLCVPISVSILLRTALEKQLNIKPDQLEENYTLENILSVMTMIVFPKSLAGMNYNPKKGEEDTQYTKVHKLLERLKFETYLGKRGWEIISRIGSAQGIFDFQIGT